MKIPKSPPDVMKLMLKNGPESFVKILSANIKSTDYKQRYLHWDKLIYLTPPSELTHEEWWAAIKFARKQSYKTIEIMDPALVSFVYSYSDEIMKELHWLDQNSSGVISSNNSIINNQTKNTYLISSLIEESINSSQLEGASTTYLVAKEMLIQGRKPKDNSEQMIFNNYKAMNFIREHKDEDLTINMILELHNILTHNTLNNAKHAGKFRTADDKVVVINYEQDVVYTPPDATLLDKRMKVLCDFANRKSTKSNSFLHPVIKAILLHFLLAYEHPFVDGNGRTARALFYWCMARENYWLMEFISISKIIKQAPVKYGMAYLYTETDDNDTTYFILHQLDVIRKGIDNLYSYLEQKQDEVRSMEDLFSTSQRLKGALNYRQLGLIKHALKHPGYIYTIAEYRNIHGISYQTARTDLLTLSEKFSFISKDIKGNEYIFSSPRNLAELIQKATK